MWKTYEWFCEGELCTPFTLLNLLKGVSSCLLDKIDMSILTFLAALPILWMVIELLFNKKNNSTLKVSIHTLGITILLAMLIWKMPIKNVAISGFEGMIMSLWPISTVIISAVFLYNICDESGNIKYIRDTLSSTSSDKRILVLIVAWGFGGFIEGVAGFGTSVAIVTSMLIALGYTPFTSAILALVANPVSSVFGSMGVQMPTLSRVTEISSSDLAINSVYAVIPIVLITPFVLVYITAKSCDIKAFFKGVWFLTSVSSVSFALAMYAVAKYVNQDLTGVVGDIFSLISMLLVIRVKYTKSKHTCKSNVLLKKQLIAWSPFIICIVLLILTSKNFSKIYNLLSYAKFSIAVPIENQPSEYSIELLTNATLWILLSSFIGGILQGLTLKKCLNVLYNTILQMWRTVITLIILLAISRIMNYSGMIEEIALSLSNLFGNQYVVLVPFIGSVGAFITGSATSANVLLGNLQVTVATELGKIPSQFMGFSIVGGTVGKMVSPQNIAIGLSTTKLSGKESEIFRIVLKWYVFYLVILIGMSVIVNSF